MGDAAARQGIEDGVDRRGKRAGHARFAAYRGAKGQGISPEEISECLLAAAPHLSRFVARLFGVERETEAMITDAKERHVLWHFKKEFAKKRLFKPTAGRSWQGSLVDAAHAPVLIGRLDDALHVGSHRLEMLLPAWATGANPIHLRAIALAARAAGIVSPGLNFRTGEFRYHAPSEEAQRQLRSTGLVAAAVLLVGLLSYGAVQVERRAELEGLRAESGGVEPRGFGTLGLAPDRTESLREAIRNDALRTDPSREPLPFHTDLDTSLPYGYDQQEPMYLPLALSVGAGFKFGCGFMLAVGISLFGLVAEHSTYATGWWLCAAISLAAAGIVLAARRRLARQ